jgi:ketosteroid isomerase-like protein
MAETRKVIETFIAHVEAGRFVEAFSMLNEDGTYTVIGATPASGTYRGRADLFTRLLPLLGTFPTPPTLKFGEIVADGDKGAFRASGAGVGPTGPYNQPYYIWYVRVQDGGFAEMIEFLDTVALETAGFGKKLVAA